MRRNGYKKKVSRTEKVWYDQPTPQEEAETEREIRMPQGRHNETDIWGRARLNWVRRKGETHIYRGLEMTVVYQGLGMTLLPQWMNSFHPFFCTPLITRLPKKPRAAIPHLSASSPWEHVHMCPLAQLYPALCDPWLFCPWDSPGKNTGVGCHFLFQEIFLSQGSNSGLLCFLHWWADSLPLSHLGSPL